MTPAPRDRGAVLPLVLVLIVIAGLVVIPVMSYTATVLKANSVVTEKSKQLEAAKGGLRAVMGSPKNVFSTCAAPSVGLGPQPTINGYVVQSTCWLLDDVGSVEALGGQIPFGTTSMQLGSEVPSDFVVGVAGTVDPVSESATTNDWWEMLASDLPLDSKIWIPNLPRQPTTVRTNTPFEMPPAFGCKVFFPGHYTDDEALELNPTNMETNRIYFASGVYYFEQPIVVSGDIDVVVGYGIEDFGNSCADDLQVAANVEGDPGSFAIDGGGATWVFGGDARLVVDDTAGSPSIRFNQRYTGSYELAALPYEGFDRGRRINIMTVNGDERDVDIDHDALDVNLVRRSALITSAGTVDDDDPTIVTAPASIEPISSSTYQPSAIELTDAARQPAQPANLDIDTYRYDDGGPVGAALLTWDAVVGQDAGGARITGYDVDVAPSPAPPHDDVCPLERQITFDDGGVEKVSCLIQGLTLGTSYSFDVVANNTSPIDGASDPSSITASPQAADDELLPPEAPASISVEETTVADQAKVKWAPPADDGGAPVTSYEIRAERVYVEPQPDQPPVVAPAELYASPGGGPVALPLPAYDPNGDSVTFTNLAGDDPQLNVALVGGVLTVDPDPLTPTSDYVLTYDATDDAGQVTSGSVTVRVVDAAAVPELPPVAAPVGLTPDLAVDATPVVVGVDTSFHVPAFDPDGDPLTDLTVGVPSPSYEPADWTIITDLSSGTITVNTVADDGTYEIPYQVSSDGTTFVDGLLTVTIARSYENLGTWLVDAAPPAPLPTAYVIDGLAPLPAVNGVEQNLGYRFDITATNGVGTSESVSSAVPYPMSFNGGGTDLEPFVATFEPHDPLAIIEVTADGAGETTVVIPGYVAVPMGKISVSNPHGDPISMVGGVLAGTYDVDDTWTVTDVVGGTPIGFWDQVILQRTVRIVSTAGNAESIAIVQVNRDNDVYGINSWTVQ